MQATKGYNPYKLGFVGGSDSHNTGVPYRQDNFFGGHGLNDGNIKERMSGHVFAGLDVRYENPAGLTGVWAEENTRASLFDAMQRKETFATSGPRIQVRLFGGWDYDNDPKLEQKRDFWKVCPTGSKTRNGRRPPIRAASRWAAICGRCRKAGRHHRSPFGRSRTRPPAISTASRSSRAGPRAGRASRRSMTSPGPDDRKPDPRAADPGDRHRPSTSRTRPTPIRSARVELKSVWTDPDFDPTLDAFYYARVLEIPTPRWTTIQAHELGISPPRDGAGNGAGARLELADLVHAEPRPA